MGKFSIIIPTLQKCKPVLNLLLDELIESDEVEEIIVIDNTRRGLGRTHSKLKVVAPCENIYVNPSFNLGMEFVNCPYWGFINDDILIPKNLLSQVGEFLTSDKVGIVGLDSEITEETAVEGLKLGDINLDGDVTIADAVVLNKYLVGSATLSESAQKNADCDKDGNITSSDTLTILKYVIGSIDEIN